VKIGAIVPALPAPAQVAGSPGSVEEAEGDGKNVLGELRARGGVNGLEEGKLLRSRRVSRAWMIFLGSPRTGMR
jgi:hypothetical protein